MKALLIKRFAVEQEIDIMDIISIDLFNRTVTTHTKGTISNVYTIKLPTSVG